MPPPRSLPAPLRGVGKQALEHAVPTISDRMTKACMTTSTTPRTTARAAEEQRLRGELIACLYEEAKLAVQENRWDQAKVMLDRIPPGYKNREQYIDQYQQQAAYKSAGIIQQEQSIPIRDLLTRILSSDSTTSCSYANRLYASGFSLAFVEHPGLHNVAQITSSAGMSTGHTLIYETYVKQTATCLEQLLFHIKKTLKECGGLKGLSEQAKSMYQKEKSDNSEES
jgi:hypothetical protein